MIGHSFRSENTIIKIVDKIRFYRIESWSYPTQKFKNICFFMRFKKLIIYFNLILPKFSFYGPKLKVGAPVFFGGFVNWN